MKKKIINIIYVFTIFCIGITLGKLINWGYFELSKEISIIDSLTFFTTIGVAIYITKNLERELQDNRVEKDLFILKISDLESKFKVIEDTIAEKDSSYSKIVCQVHSCRLTKKKIFDSINGNFTHSQKDMFEDFDNKITLCINSLKRLLTDTPISNTNNPDINLVSGVVNYSTNRIIEISSEMSVLLDHLFKLKVRINHL